MTLFSLSVRKQEILLNNIKTSGLEFPDRLFL